VPSPGTLRHLRWPCSSPRRPTRRSTAFLAAEKSPGAQPQRPPGGCRSSPRCPGVGGGGEGADRGRTGPPGSHLGGAGSRGPVPVQRVELLVELVVELRVPLPRVHHFLRGESGARGCRHPAQPRTPRHSPPFPSPSPLSPCLPGAPPDPGQRVQASGRARSALAFSSRAR